MEASAKYPLERKWVLWEMWDTRNTANFLENQKAIGKFDTL